jgi:tetratricopeptide (TPR) repeat protein
MIKFSSLYYLNKIFYFSINGNIDFYHKTIFCQDSFCKLKMRIITVWLVIFFSFYSCLPVFAQENNSPVSGKELFMAGLYQQALEKLNQEFRNDPASAEINFYLGRAAFELGDYESALMAYERILINEPDNTRVQLETARCHMELQSYGEAREIFKKALAVNPPPAVQRNIKMLLSIIAAREKKHSFSGLLSVGLAYDDNVRVSPANRLISTIIGDVLLEGSGAEKESDAIYTTTLALNHTYALPDRRFSWITSGTIYNGFYQDEHDLDLNFFGLTTGLAWQGKKMIWKNQMTANHLELGYDRYMEEYGLESVLVIYPIPAVILSLGSRIANRDYFQNSDKDSLNSRFNLLTSITSGKHRLSLDMGLEYENSNEKMYQYDRFVLGMRYDYSLNNKMSGFFSLRNQDSKYQGREAMFAEKRHDDITYCTIGLARTLWSDPESGKNLTLQISHTYTDADSNLDLYCYRKNVTLSTLTYLF